MRSSFVMIVDRFHRRSCHGRNVFSTNTFSGHSPAVEFAAALMGAQNLIQPTPSFGLRHTAEDLLPERRRLHPDGGLRVYSVGDGNLSWADCAALARLGEEETSRRCGSGNDWT